MQNQLKGENYKRALDCFRKTVKFEVRNKNMVIMKTIFGFSFVEFKFYRKSVLPTVSYSPNKCQKSRYSRTRAKLVTFAYELQLSTN